MNDPKDLSSAAMQVPSEALRTLIDRVESREALGADVAPQEWIHTAAQPGETLYENKMERLGIDFQVERCAFPEMQTLDPRIIRIPPGKNNEYHKHAHESLFVILSGEGEVRVGDDWMPVRKGDVAFVPRWIFHQSRNTSDTETLVILAITDFGFTKAVLGDYDKRTRLAAAGEDVQRS